MRYQELAYALNGLSAICHTASAEAGWWATGKTDKNVLGAKVALIHSEVSEALEGIRKDTKDSHLTNRLAVEVELADALIRIFDLAGALNLDVGGALIEKLDYNAKRADHKPENRAKEGGKKI